MPVNLQKLISRYQGFTLTEVVVTSLLMVVVMVPILRGLTAAHQMDTIIERRTKSLILAQNKLEDIRARSIYSYGTNFNDASSSMDGLYLCKVLDSSVSADLRFISVAVGYDQNTDGSLDPDEVQVTLQTLLARRW